MRCIEVKDVAIYVSDGIYDFIIKHLSLERLRVLIEIGKKYNFGRGAGHASKVMELSLILWKNFKSDLELEDDTAAIALIIAGLLHDIGVSISSRKHHEISYSLLKENHLEELRRAFDNRTVDISLWLVYHHRNKTGNPMDDINIPEDIRAIVTKLTALLRLADGLDRGLDQSVKDIKVKRDTNEITLIVQCDYSCDYDIYGGNKKKRLIETLLKKPIKIVRS